jgi:hypothetical protein
MNIDINEIERIAKAGDPWGYAATPANVLELIAEVRRLREEIVAFKAHDRTLMYELMGVVADVEQGHGFDTTCLDTIKRVMGELGSASK